MNPKLPQSKKKPRNFILEQKIEQRVKNQKSRARHSQFQNTKMFWQALKAQVTEEVVKINIKREELSDELHKFGKKQRAIDKDIISGQQCVNMTTTSPRVQSPKSVHSKQSAAVGATGSEIDRNEDQLSNKTGGYWPSQAQI